MTLPDDGGLMMRAMRRPSIDWKTERERIDLATVATALLGPASGRRGEHGRRMWWSCPLGTHDDRNPSFAIDPGQPFWRCFGCGESGDAANLLMRVQGIGFPEAVRALTGGGVQASHRPRTNTPASPPIASRPPAAPSGLPEADALELVEAAAGWLWDKPEALAYLTGPERCLSAETIRAARIGWLPGAAIPRAGGGAFMARGWVIPWFAAGRLALVKIRQPHGRQPKYVEAFRDPSRVVCYPSPETIRPGRPLVGVEGEFDCLCLGEALEGMAAVVTLGGASGKPTPEALSRIRAASVLYAATDADNAGERAASGWPARARRVRPPVGKDWTDCRAYGIDLRRWWGEVLDGNPSPKLFSWDELSTWRWGPAINRDNVTVDSEDLPLP